jgi:C4-type Zn-finger protein
MDKETAERLGLPYDPLLDDTSDVAAPAQAPLSSLVSGDSGALQKIRERVLRTLDESDEESRRYQETLNRIEEAKQRLLAAPDKRQVLQGFVSKLTAPKERTDPRFYERRNLFTFLRDVGEYGQEQREAEKEREAKRVMLQEMQAKYGMEQAEKRRGRAEQLIAQYLSKEPTEKTQTTSEFERLIADLPPEEQAKLRQDRARILTTRPTPAALIEKPDTLARDYEIVANPDQYPPNVVAAAQARIERFKPADVRKDERAELAKENLYRSRISRQSRVVIPDIDRAIKILDESPNIAAGNFSNWLVDLPVFGQEAKDLDSILKSVKASVGFGQLEDLKLMSPSGASGLGAVSNFEQQVLQSVEGSLSRDMSASNLKQNLQRLKTFYEVDLPAFIESKGIDLSGVGNRPEKPSGEGKSPAEMAADELRRRRAGKGG